jgi:hypothetical protein
MLDRAVVRSISFIEAESQLILKLWGRWKQKAGDDGISSGDERARSTQGRIPALVKRLLSKITGIPSPAPSSAESSRSESGSLISDAHA